VTSRRLSSYDRTGGNQDAITIAGGETAVIAEIATAGVITHIWITIDADDPMIRRNAVLRAYWDGETNPSIESPIGDFFGQGWGETYNFASLPLAAAPVQGRALNSYFPMPFAEGARISVENQSELPIRYFYFVVDYEEHRSLAPDTGRFHAWWNRELTTPAHGIENEWNTLAAEQTNPSDRENYLFADIAGKGHVVGINYFVENPGPIWYGEGDDMWLIDGEAWPGSLHGTGTEDFFNASWAPNEIYLHSYFGYARVPNTLGWLGRTHCYRFFLADPICFERSVRASIEHGHANALTLDIASVAYWYQTEPHKAYPPLPLKERRQNMPEIGVVDVHRWRHAWREAKGGGAPWGNG
jgi:hypothetical protein